MITNFTKYENLITSSVKKDVEITNLKSVIRILFDKVDKTQFTAKQLYRILVDGLGIEGIQPRKTKEYYMGYIDELLTEDEFWQ